MQINEIHISIGPDGSVRTEMKGFDGDACLEASRPLEEGLGAQIVDRQRITLPSNYELTEQVEEVEREQLRG